ncbi:MAG: hypothetical protein IKS47_04670, partial [Bacteroidales bacterium]|nr:hypothetical protein [Bacteroidales bacterium]
MKRILPIISVLLALTSCVSQLDNADNLRLRADNGGKVFYATIEGNEDDENGPETKVYADDQMRVLWNKNDYVAIFDNYSYGVRYRFTGRDGATAGRFVEDPVDGYVVGSDIEGIYAVYPYQDDPEIALDHDGILTLTLPETQTYKKNSFGIGANTMVSVTDNQQLRFRNVGGYLSFKLYGWGISVSSIQLKGNNHEKLAGEAKVTMALGGTPATVMQDNATEEVTLECETPVALGATAEEYTEFWFVIPPTTFTQGFTVTVTDSHGGTFRMSTQKEIE